MLQQICETIHNFFIKEAHTGAWEIAGSMISPVDFLKDGQRFWMVGSDLNDGVYTYHQNGIMNDDDTAVAGLRAETFNGTICAMAVPPAVIELAGEIKDWVWKYGSVIDSPYQSESFNGYSYSRQTASAKDGNSAPAGWQDVFAKRLNAWRKVSL